jgi:GGDEF domain-containing protein
MHDETFRRGFTKEFLKQYNIDPQSIIFEITEKDVITDIDSFKYTISYYKSQNYSIAIDDAGSGYSGLNLISDVNPHFIKLDMKLIRGISKDRLKFSLVKGMVEFSKASNISIIAEGIETYEELETIINLGVQYGQGYYFQTPEAEIKDINQSVLKDIIEINSRKNHISIGATSNIYIQNFSKTTHVVPPDEKVGVVYEDIIRNEDCQGLCVVENYEPVGIVTKEKIALKLSGNYGYSLYKNRCISGIMDKEFLRVEYDTPINVVSNLAMERSNDKLYDLIVVTENGKYIGTVTIKDLLQKTTELEVSAAKHQNPLSGLPGNILIEQNLNQLLLNSSEYSIAYLDIDNFKAYNDVYGFERGDKVINLLSDILKKNINNFYFVGHIGGDDFIVMVDKYVSEDYFTDVVNDFERNVVNFYNDIDIRNGYIITANRKGRREKFPLITLTCVVLNNDLCDFTDVGELTKKLADLKKCAKQRLRI